MVFLAWSQCKSKFPFSGSHCCTKNTQCEAELGKNHNACVHILHSDGAHGDFSLLKLSGYFQGVGLRETFSNLSNICTFCKGIYYFKN